MDAIMNRGILIVMNIIYQLIIKIFALNIQQLSGELIDIKHCLMTMSGLVWGENVNPPADEDH